MVLILPSCRLPDLRVFRSDSEESPVETELLTFALLHYGTIALSCYGTIYLIGEEKGFQLKKQGSGAMFSLPFAVYYDD